MSPSDQTLLPQWAHNCNAQAFRTLAMRTDEETGRSRLESPSRADVEEPGKWTDGQSLH
jgi:hypothetical protein